MPVFRNAFTRAATRRSVVDPFTRRPASAECEISSKNL
jgi:hypothetical protein